MEIAAILLEQLPPAFRQLASLAPLDATDLKALEAAAHAPRAAPAKRDFTASLAAATGPVLILDGWALRACLLSDGRRQITELFLPGDIISGQPTDQCSSDSIGAITAVTWCSLHAASVAPGTGLNEALSAVEVIKEQSLRRHIVRLGRLDALGRLADWLLELHARLDTAGLAAGNTMHLPLTQEMIGDALGLTSVHVNRTLGALRREGLIEVQAGRAIILNADRCRTMVGLTPSGPWTRSRRGT